MAPTDVDAHEPRTARGERTAARLRDAAREIFGEVGYAAARVEDIVARAGVSHGTFYTYYVNKAAILDAMVTETAALLSEVVAEPVWDVPDASAAVEAVIGRFVDVFLRDAEVIRTWIEASAHEQHFLDRLREVRLDYVQRVAEHLDPVVRDSDHDAHVAAAALVAMVEGYATRGLIDNPEVTREQAVATLAALWVGGLLQLAQD